MVTGPAEVMRMGMHSLGQFVAVAAVAAVVVPADGSLEHPDHQRRARRRANRRGTDAVRIADAFLRQTVEVRRLDELVSVAAEVR